MKTVLDIGAHAGGASAPYVQQGDRWIWVDNEQYIDYGWPHPVVPGMVERYIMDAMEYNEPADVVVCSNVLYHVEDPWALIKHLRHLTKHILILRTYYDSEGTWNFYGKDNPAHPHAPTAATIFYRPTVKALEKELKKHNFASIKGEVKDNIVTFICKVEEDE